MAIIRLNYGAYEAGEEHLIRLNDEADRNFRVLLSLLSSYWKSTVDGPNYTRELKAMALSLARIRLALEDIQSDISFSTTRTEYLYQTTTSLLFPGEIPNLQNTDVEFKEFLVKLVDLYFAGSTPDTIKKAVELVTGGTVIIKEPHVENRKYGLVRNPGDDFSFDVDVILSSPGSMDSILADRNIRLLLGIIRPGHILYRTRFIINDIFLGVSTLSRPQKVTDSLFSNLSDYSYEDFRKFVEGIEGIDYLGSKKSVSVTGEDHSSDF